MRGRRMDCLFKQEEREKMSLASLHRPPLGLWVPSPKGGSAPYAAKAVHFDGMTELIRSTLSCVDGPVSFSFWIKTVSVSNKFIWVIDPVGNFSTYLSIDNTGRITISL